MNDIFYDHSFCSPLRSYHDWEVWWGVWSRLFCTCLLCKYIVYSLKLFCNKSQWQKDKTMVLYSSPKKSAVIFYIKVMPTWFTKKLMVAYWARHFLQTQNKYLSIVCRKLAFCYFLIMCHFLYDFYICTCITLVSCCKFNGAKLKKINLELSISSHHIWIKWSTMKTSLIQFGIGLGFG